MYAGLGKEEVLDSAAAMADEEEEEAGRGCVPAERVTSGSVELERLARVGETDGLWAGGGSRSIVPRTSLGTKYEPEAERGAALGDIGLPGVESEGMARARGVGLVDCNAPSDCRLRLLPLAPSEESARSSQSTGSDHP